MLPTGKTGQHDKATFDVLVRYVYPTMVEQTAHPLLLYLGHVSSNCLTFVNIYRAIGT